MVRTQNRSRFADLLTKAVNQIHASEQKSKGIVRDELGFAAGKGGGRTAVDYWCRDGGHIPELLAVDSMAREIVRRNGLSPADVRLFLLSAGFAEGDQTYKDLCSTTTNTAVAEQIIEHQVLVEEPKVSESKPPINEPRRYAFSLTSKPILAGIGVGAVLLASLGLISLERSASTHKSESATFATGASSQLVVQANGRVLASGDLAKVGEFITVTFTVINNGFEVGQIETLVIGSHGPGASCNQNHERKWSTPDVPFPTMTNISLRPGEIVTYTASRILYLPGTYFLEPVLQDTSGQWHGISPFTCFDLKVGL